MFPWNRKEVYTGFSIEEFSRVQNALASNGIHFETRVVDPSRTKGIFTESRFPAPFLDRRFVCQYYVYVAPENYEQATYLLNRQ